MSTKANDDLVEMLEYGLASMPAAMIAPAAMLAGFLAGNGAFGVLSGVAFAALWLAWAYLSFLRDASSRSADAAIRRSWSDSEAQSLVESIAQAKFRKVVLSGLLVGCAAPIGVIVAVMTGNLSLGLASAAALIVAWLASVKLVFHPHRLVLDQSGLSA